MQFLNYNIEETIQKESVVISITNQGYIKRSPLKFFKSSKKRWKRKNRYFNKRRRFCCSNIYCKYTYTSIIFFNSRFSYKIKAHKIPEGTAASKGKSIFNILPTKKSSFYKFNNAFT